MKFTIVEIINFNPKNLVDIFSALLTPAIAIFVALIAWFQWRTHKEQVKNELFDRRFAMFEAVNLFINTLCGYGKVLDHEYEEYLSKTKGAIFIFNDKISNFIKEVGEKANQHKCNDDLLKARPSGDQTREDLIQRNAEIFKWYEDALLITTIEEIFKKDLKLRSKIKLHIQFLKQTRRAGAAIKRFIFSKRYS